MNCLLSTIKNLFLVAVLIAISSCSSDSAERNPFLIERPFSYEINLNLPQYAALNVPGSSAYIPASQAGLKGVFVYNQGFGTYLAWEASCPNHTPSPCSTMKLENQVFSRCSCEQYQYSLVNGALLNPPPSERHYGLLPYRVSAGGSYIRISN